MEVVGISYVICGGRSVISPDQTPSRARFHQTQLTVTLPVAQTIFTKTYGIKNLKDLFRGRKGYASRWTSDFFSSTGVIVTGVNFSSFIYTLQTFGTYCDIPLIL